MAPSPRAMTQKLPVLSEGSGQRDHRSRTRRIRARMVAASAVRRRDGSPSGCREPKPAACIPGAGQDGSRADLAGAGLQWDRTRRLVRRYLEVKHRSRTVFQIHRDRVALEDVMVVSVAA